MLCHLPNILLYLLYLLPELIFDMPKIVFVLLGLVILVAGLFWFTGSSPAGSALADEVTSVTLELEDVLDDLAVSIRHDDMSAEELLHTRRYIISYFDRIDVATARASGRNVTREDLSRIQDGLGRLARILETYLESLAELDRRIATIPATEFPEDIEESERERTVLMSAITTITDLTEVATVEGSTGEALDDTIFDEDSDVDPVDMEDVEDNGAVEQPTGETAGEAIHLDLAPAN